MRMMYARSSIISMCNSQCSRE